MHESLAILRLLRWTETVLVPHSIRVLAAYLAKYPHVAGGFDRYGREDHAHRDAARRYRKLFGEEPDDFVPLRDGAWAACGGLPHADPSAGRMAA